MKAFLLAVVCVLPSLPLAAHDWHRHEDPQFAMLQPLTLAKAEIIAEESRAVQWAAVAPVPVARVEQAATGAASGTRAFEASFAPFAPKVKTRSDARWFYVESDGLPAHNMMVGITAWQQQVPLPHSYFGDNAWRIPLHPVPAKTPASIKNRFLRGAIALAANGIPIFNPQNNRGEVSKEIGELDQWGGHCGRADDYHYHAAPLHLQTVLGKALPIAYALDGYPIYGLTEPDGSAPSKLDACNGHETGALGYHYHGSMKYPYVNGGFHGEVVEAGGQVDPQPSAGGWRGAGAPLRGAKITGFTSKDHKTFSLKYEVSGETRAINYTLSDTKTARFDYVDGRGQVTTEIYSQQGRGGGGGERPPRGPGGNGGPRNGPERGGPRADAGRPPEDRAEARPSRDEGGSVAAENFTPKRSGNFTLRSPAVADGGALPVEFTGDGASSTLPLEWTGAPAGTKSFAVIMHHIDPEGKAKWYWTLYNIPADVHGLPKNVQGVGTLGNNGINRRVGYAPPHSKGPGAKSYILTAYALSAPVEISAAPSEVNREVLLAAMKDRILDSAELKVVYTRNGSEPADEQRPPRREEGDNQLPPRREQIARTDAQPQSAAQVPPNESAPPRRGNQRSAPGGGRGGGGGDNKGLIKPTMADTIKVNVYADNWFVMYINGKLRAVDSIEFTPHNVVSVDLLPEYPMTIAIMAKDNADPKTGLEYGDHIGDGGFIIRFADGTVSNAKWKAKSFFKGPLNRDAQNPRVEHTPIPTNWFAVNFDDSQWANAVEYTEERVNPKEPFYSADFKGAKFIWTSDLDLDNTVVFRTRVEKPGWKPRWNTKPDLDVSGAPSR
jgi:phosphatidylethanolamine-binding protein (PEBP) family uncharacterized protein